MKENVDKVDIVEIREEGDTLIVYFIAPVVLSQSKNYDDSFDCKSMLSGKTALTLDLSKLASYDSYLVILLNEISVCCQKESIKFETIGISKELADFIDILTPNNNIDDAKEKRSYWVDYFSHIGDVARVIFSDAYLLIEFVGELVKNAIKVIFKPSLMRWKDFPLHLTNAGVNAVPITMLIVFLIGLISGYQGAVQLAQFGADIFIADLIGISITRELSPLMVAIIVAGRSGSAFAAEIGTMKVSEEIDALKTMGFDRMQFLVLPRVLAVAVSMPILVMICNVAGIAGGMIAGLASLDITISSFMGELQVALSYWDVFGGLFKSFVFGLLIATIGCFRGFQVQGGAESVGKYTTASVVSGIFLVILVDALFVFLLTSLGI